MLNVSLTKLPARGEILLKLQLRNSSLAREGFVKHDDIKISLEKSGGFFEASIRLKNPEESQSVVLNITLTDIFNRTIARTVATRWSIKDAYLYFASKNGFNESMAVELFNESPLMGEVYAHDRKLTEKILLLASQGPHNLSENVAFQALKLVENRFEAAIYLEILYNTRTFRAKPETLEAIEYYVKAVRSGLPMHDYSTLKLFINASNKNPELVDFEPVIVSDGYGHRVAIQWYNKPRDTWMIVEFLKRNPYVASNDNLYLPVNMMIKEMAWNFFDNKFGPRYADKYHNNLTDSELDKIYQPTNEDIWYIIQKLWDYYYTGINKRYQYVKWWDREEFAKQYPSELERKLILIGLWDLPNQVADFSHTHPDVRGGWDYDVVWGLKAQKLFVDQLEQMYEILEKTRVTNEGKWEYNWGWYQWIIDRGHNGLPNMHEQFLGAKVGDIHIPFRGEYDNWTWYENIFKYNGVDQFLTKNFADYERVKVAYGYVGYHAADYGGEMPSYYYGLVLAFKAYGIPTRINTTGTNQGESGYTNIYIYPVPYGQPGNEFIFPLPKEIRDLLKQKYGNSIVFTPEGGFGMYSLKDGLEKDGIEEIGTYIYRITRDINVIYPEKYRIILWKK